MRIMILSCAFMISSMVSSFAAAVPVRYIDNIFTNVTVTSNVTFGSNRNYNGATVTLQMDIYQPTGDTASKRPLFVFVHGGGFSGGSKLDYDMPALCNTFAKKGYVTMSPNYRTDPNAGSNSTVMAAASIRALQDVKAAVRYLRANKTTYKIDDTKIFLGGTSAGGVIALNYAYLDNAEAARAMDTSATGGVEGNSGTPGVSSAINGILNCWGCVGDSTVLYNATIPVISFCGSADNVVPPDVGYSLGNPDLISCGSICVNRVLNRRGIVRSVLKVFIGGGHPPSAPGNRPWDDTLVPMTAQFAYNVLFGGTSTMHFVKSTPRTEQLSAMQSIAFGRALAGKSAMHRRQGTVYSLDGRASRMSADTRISGSAAGIYIFQPALK
jgi:para-nitrobenzyl esterase